MINFNRAGRKHRQRFSDRNTKMSLDPDFFDSLEDYDQYMDNWEKDNEEAREKAVCEAEMKAKGWFFYYAGPLSLQQHQYQVALNGSHYWDFLRARASAQAILSAHRR
jgi:hypothetical protein